MHVYPAPSMAAHWENKVAVVTGAGRGIGRAFALALAAEGCRVAVADVDIAGAEATANEIASSGGAAAGLHVDVTERGSVANLMLGRRSLGGHRHPCQRCGRLSPRNGRGHGRSDVGPRA